MTRGIRHAGPKRFFTVSEVHYTDPITYKLKDLNGEEIKGSFYEQKLQKTTQEMFRIENVIRRKGDKSLVKWVGSPVEFNSWIDNKDLVKLHFFLICLKNDIC